MVDNIRAIGWLLLCLAFELLAISAVSAFRGGARETPGKSLIMPEAQTVKVMTTNVTVY